MHLDEWGPTHKTLPWVGRILATALSGITGSVCFKLGHIFPLLSSCDATY